jgi:hypothetical protein
LRQGLVLVCGLVTSILCACTIVAAEGQAARTVLCKRDYSYAGFQSAVPTAGVRANLKVLERPVVRAGHVGGWVGVGGLHAGPGRTAQWLQVGYSAFPDGTMQLYYEVTLPNSAPRYHVVKEAVRPGESHLVSILEAPKQRGVWRVSVDGVAVGPGYFLRGSDSKYRPQGIGESWAPTASECNSFAWMFGNVEVTARPGATWVLPTSDYQWHDTGYGVKLIPPDSFATYSR